MTLSMLKTHDYPFNYHFPLYYGPTPYPKKSSRKLNLVQWFYTDGSNPPYMTVFDERYAPRYSILPSYYLDQTFGFRTQQQQTNEWIPLQSVARTSYQKYTDPQYVDYFVNPGCQTELEQTMFGPVHPPKNYHLAFDPAKLYRNGLLIN